MWNMEQNRQRSIQVWSDAQRRSLHEQYKNTPVNPEKTDGTITTAGGNIVEDGSDNNTSPSVPSLPDVQPCLFNLSLTEQDIIDIVGDPDLNSQGILGVLDFNSEENVYSTVIDSESTLSRINAAQPINLLELEEPVSFEFFTTLPNMNPSTLQSSYHAFALFSGDEDFDVSINFGSFSNGSEVNNIIGIQSYNTQTIFEVPENYTSTIRYGITIYPNRLVRITSDWLSEPIFRSVRNDTVLLVSIFEWFDVAPSDFGKEIRMNLVTDANDFIYEYPRSTDLCGNLLPNFIEEEQQSDCSLNLGIDDVFINRGENPFDEYDGSKVIVNNSVEWQTMIGHTQKFTPLLFNYTRGFEVRNTFQDISIDNITYIGLLSLGDDTSSDSGIVLVYGLFSGDYWHLYDFSREILVPIFPEQNPSSNVGFYVSPNGHIGIIIDGKNYGWYDYNSVSFVENEPTHAPTIVDFKIALAYLPFENSNISAEIEIIEKGNFGFPTGVRNWCEDDDSVSEGTNSEFIEIVIPDTLTITETNPNNILFSNNNIYQNLVIESITVDEEVWVDFNNNLLSVRGEDLEQVGSLFFSTNDNLQEILLPSLTTVDEAISIIYSDLLSNIDLSSLQTVGISINIGFLDDLQSIDFPELISVGGDAFGGTAISVTNTNIESISFDNLQIFGTDFSSMQLQNNNLSVQSVEYILNHLSQNTVMNNRNLWLTNNGVNLTMLSTQANDSYNDLLSRGWNIYGL